METKTTTKVPAQKAAELNKGKEQTTNEQVAPKKDKKTRKKNSSALAAASMGRSAVSNAGAHAYRDGGFAQSGTNLSYREEDGVL